MIRLIKRIFNRYAQAHRARIARQRFNDMVRAFDDSIARAQAKHQSTRALRKAKRDFVHSMLRGAVR